MSSAPLLRQDPLVTSWTTRFTRSRIAPGVFNVKVYEDEPLGFLEELLAELGLPTATEQKFLSHGYRSTPVLGGFLLYLSTYGWAPVLRSGYRIVGFDAFRLLCLLFDLEGPRRLKGEPPLRTESELLEMLAEQVAKPEVDLLERAKWGLGVDRAERVVAVAQVAAEGYRPVPETWFVPDVMRSFWSMTDGRNTLAGLAARRSTSAGDLFLHEPENWGLRGDPHVWREMQAALSGLDLPASDAEAENLFRSTFETVVKVDLSNPDQEMEVEREEFNHGGMSGGVVSLSYWVQELLPLLVARARIARGDEPLGPSTQH